MAVAYGTRINDTNFITEIDLDNNTCETTGYIDVWLTDAIITGDCEVTFKGPGVDF